MKNKKLLLIAFICFTSLVSGQSSYQVGVGQQSLEPDKSTISLALSGYSAPREGRFTLQWIKQETLPAVTAIGGVSDRLYIISKGELLWKHVSDKTGWKKAGKSENLITITGFNNKLNKKIVVIKNIDLVSLTNQYIGMLMEEIYKKHKIPPSAVLMNISHTHFAPVVQESPTWVEHNQHPNKAYLYSTVKSGILSAVDKALESMAPAHLYFGRGKTYIAYNSSLGDHPELYDNSVDVLKVTYSENYLFLASCHAVFGTAGKSHYTISANFPGIARKLLEERTNTLNSLLLQGTEGDINPRDEGEYIT